MKPEPTLNLAPQKLTLTLTLLAGVFVGLAAFTFQYAEGLSYFSEDPAACTNCHIMQPQFDSWQKASHHTVATCNNCHLPKPIVFKLLAKAENGFWHSKGFTFQDFPEPIRMRPISKDILLDNCQRCHSDFMHAVTSVGGARDEVDCLHCHRSAGHGDTIGLGRFDPDELTNTSFSE